MIIEYRLETKNKEVAMVADDFCKFIVKNIRQDIVNSVNQEMIQSRETNVLEANWIDWNKKPKAIDMFKLVKFIVQNIGFKTRRKNTYVILINPKVNMPSSNTKLERVARFLDKGNDNSMPTSFLTSIFNRYRSNMNEYWKAYVESVLRIYEVDELIVIRSR